MRDLREDYRGRYWDTARTRYPLPNPSARVSRCAHAHCLWQVRIERAPDGHWYWRHDHMPGWDDRPTRGVSGGPFPEWQLAADDAVERGFGDPWT